MRWWFETSDSGSRLADSENYHRDHPIANRPIANRPRPIIRIGRRKQLIIGAFGSSISMWYIGGYITASDIESNQLGSKSVAGWAAIACVYAVSPINQHTTLYFKTDL